MVSHSIAAHCVIGELTPSEWPLFKLFRLQAMRTEPVAFKTSYRENKLMSDKAWEQELKLSELGQEVKLLFIRYKKELIGMLGIRYDPTEKRRHVAYIFEVYLKKKYRGQGFGRHLLTFALEHIKRNKRQIKKVQLSVTESQDAALRLYYAVGFNVVGCAQQEKKIRNKYYDQYLMEKFIR